MKCSENQERGKSLKKGAAETLSARTVCVFSIQRTVRGETMQRKCVSLGTTKLESALWTIVRISEISKAELFI